MSREQLETMLGINLHDPMGADSALQCPGEPLYREHKAGASYEPGKVTMPVRPLRQ